MLLLVSWITVYELMILYRLLRRDDTQNDAAVWHDTAVYSHTLIWVPLLKLHSHMRDYEYGIRLPV